MNMRYLPKWGPDEREERPPRSALPKPSLVQTVTQDSTPEHLMRALCAAVQARSPLILFVRQCSDQITTSPQLKTLHMVMNETVEMRTPQDIEVLSRRLSESFSQLAFKGEAGIVVIPTAVKWVYQLKCAVALSSVALRRQKVKTLTK